MTKFIIFIVLLCGFHSYKFVGGVVDDTEAQDAFERVHEEGIVILCRFFAAILTFNIVKRIL